MRVTTSLLADAATVADSKLYIHGAGWDQITTASLPTIHPNIGLALVIEFDASDSGQRNIEVTLVNQNDEPLLASARGHIEIDDSIELEPDAVFRYPIAVNFSTVLLPRAERYRFVLRIDGEEVHSTYFSLRAASQ